MADLEKTVSIIFSGTDKTSNVISGLGRNLDQFSGKVQDVSGPLAGFASGVLKTEAALGAMTVGGLALAINESGKFGDSFKEITTLIDDTGAGVDQFRADILAYAQDSGKSLEDIMAGLYAAKSAGVEYTYTLGTLADAEKLSIAAKAELADTTKVLASTLNAYGEETDQATKYSDILFKTVKLGQTTFPELANSLSGVTTIAANAGIPFETLSAAIAALTATGMPTSQAITSIKSAISAIIKPSTQATELANKLGIGFDAATLKSKGFETILWDVQKATGGSADKMSLLFGSVEALPTVMVLGADSVGRFKKDLVEMANAAGATEKAYRKMVDNFKEVNQNLSNNVKVVLIEVGDKILTRYKEIVGESADVLKGIAASINKGDFDGLFSILDAVGKDLQDLLGGIAEVLPEALENVDWSPLEASFGSLKEMFGGLMDAVFGEGVDLTTAEGLTQTINTLVKVFSGLNEVVAGIGGSWTPFIEKFVDGLKGASDSNQGTQEFVGNILGLGQAINVIAGLGGGAAGVLGGIAGVLSTLVNLKLASLITNVGSLSTGLAALTKIGTIGIVVGLSIIGLDYVLDKIKDLQEKRLPVNVEPNWKDLDNDMPGYLPIKIKPEIDFSAEDIEDTVSIKPEIDFSAEDIEDAISSAFRVTPFEVNILPNFDALQSEWDSITSEMDNFVDSFTFDIDPILDLSPIADMPKDIDPIELPVVPDKDRLHETKRKICNEIAGMSPINVPVSLGENGMGPINEFRDAWNNQDPLDLPESAIDFGGIADLFGQLEDAEGTHKAMIENAIRRQMALAEKQAHHAMNLAEKIQGHIETMDMMMSSTMDDKTIKIEADGLEPEMEAFMWKLLKLIQVRANESGAEFLLAAAN